MMIKPKNIVEPVIKWSGSKRYVALELSRHIAKQKRYIEPFIGGGAMLLQPIFRDPFLCQTLHPGVCDLHDLFFLRC